MNSRLIRNALALTLAGSTALQAVPVITAITSTDTEVILTIQADGTFDQFNIEASLDLEAGTWGPISSINTVSLGQNRYRLTVAKPAADREFYRVIGRFLGTALDLDGDGLDNDRETNELGTDPNKFDTDGDGFSDATEIALGTDPLDIDDFPELASLPAVDFAETISSIEEGQGPQTITLVSSSPYTGQISLSVNSERSSAKQGDDYTGVPSTVFMSGGSATFNIDIIDDLEIHPDRMLVIDLEIPPAGSVYRAAGSTTHILNIKDNDAYWSGNMRDGLTERQFRLCLLKNSSTVQAEFVSGQNDGLPDADGGNSSASTGVIPDTDFNGDPKESWPASNLVYDLNNPEFRATAADLPAVNNGALSTRLKRTLVFTATPGTSVGQIVLPNYISGTYQENITHESDPTITHLNRTINGIFSLAREVTTGPAVNSPYDPTDD